VGQTFQKQKNAQMSANNRGIHRGNPNIPSQNKNMYALPRSDKNNRSPLVVFNPKAPNLSDVPGRLISI